MSAVKPVLSPLSRCALETEAHVGRLGWGQGPRLFSLARNGELIKRQPALKDVLGDPNEFSAIEQEDAFDGGKDLQQVLGHLSWPKDVEGVALAVERVIIAPPTAAPTSHTKRASQADREDVRLFLAASRDGEIITLVRRKADDSDDSVAIGTNIAPGLMEALKATLGL